MDTLRKIWQSKTLSEMLTNITYSSLKKLSFFMLVLFVVNSNIKMLTNISEIEFLSSVYWVFWTYYNRYFLLFTTIIFIILILKSKQDHLSLNIKNTLKGNPVFVLFLIFIFLMVISTIVNGRNMMALIGDGYCAEGLIGYISYIFYFFITFYSLDKEHQHKFLKILVCSSCINIFASVFDHVCLNAKYEFLTENTIFYNSNHYGYYLLVVAVVFGMFFLSTKAFSKKFFYLLMYALIIGCLLINDTLGCQLALFITLIFICIVYSITKGKFMPTTLILILVYFSVFVFGYVCSDTIEYNIDKNFLQLINDSSYGTDKEIENTTGTLRLDMWKHTLEYISERPLLGFAAEGTSERLDNDTSECRVHNDYLLYTVNYGIPAALIYIVSIFMIFLRGLKYKKELTNINLSGLCCAFAYLVSAFLGNSMFYTAPYLFIMLGLGYYKTNK